jgi:uncharacterized RmlC-like cupin family protein
MGERITVVASTERPATGPPTPGMESFEAFVTDDRWIGYAETEPGIRSGWHHHGEMDSYIYVVRGAIELESGPNGRTVTTAHAGEFAHVPARTVHREGTPGTEAGSVVVVRIGRGQPVFAVDGPDPEEEPTQPGPTG